MRAYEVRDREHSYYTCWVVAETPAKAKHLARQLSPKLRGWEYEELRARLAPDFEDGEDLGHAHFICDIDTGREPWYGFGYSI